MDMTKVFEGKKVAIFVAGDLLTCELIESVEADCFIAVEIPTCLPRVDIMYMANPAAFNTLVPVDGVRFVSGLAGADSEHYPMQYDHANIGHGENVEFYNPMLNCVRLAVELGAKDILVVGGDSHRVQPVIDVFDQTVERCAEDGVSITRVIYPPVEQKYASIGRIEQKNASIDRIEQKTVRKNEFRQTLSN